MIDGRAVPRGRAAARALADGAGVRHRLEHQPAALPARASRLSRRRKPRRRLDDAGQHRRLRQVEVLGLAVEIMLRGRAQAVDAVAEIDARQVAREDLVLGQPGLPARTR